MMPGFCEPSWGSPTNLRPIEITWTLAGHAPPARTESARNDGT